MIGQRALDDPRNALVREFVRIVAELRATYFVFENVKGLTVGRHREFLNELIQSFEAVGYRVKLPWTVLNASTHGVPQDRKRLFLLGVREGFDLPDYPEVELTRGPTCRDALDDLPEAEDYAELFDCDEILTKAWGKPSVYARRMRCLTNDAWVYGHPRNWDPSLLTSSMRTNHTDISRRRFAETEPGTTEPISRFYKLAADGLSNTLRAGTDTARGAFTSPRPIHYSRPRCVTVREMARLHGFPDWFRFHETKWHGARQIGNAVPPPLARAVATKIVEALSIEPTRPETVVELGDPALLKMSLSQASKFWGVPNPIGRRDRKSGARKRKQVDIEAERLASQGLAHG